MKLLLRYATAIGSRTIIAEISDPATAQALRAAHEALGEAASLVEEMPRICMADHLAKHRRRQARTKIKLIESVPNVTPLKRRSKS